MILYAADSDVVKLFTDPYSNATTRRVRKQTFPGYAEIIPGQERDVSEALGWVLANFIFSKLSDEWPIFILPPANNEITDIFNAVARDAEKERTKALLSVRRLEEWTKSHKHVAIDRDYFQNNLPEVLTVLAGERTFSAELVRFSRLLNSRKLYTLDQFLLISKLPNEEARKALTPPSGISQMVEFGQMIKDWERRVADHRPDLRQHQNIDVDARMLARLEWINRSFANSNFKLVLITGSQLVADVCRKYRSNRFRSAKSFADLFIRSPRAYLGDPNVVSPMLESNPISNRADYTIGRRLQDWLSTVLGADERKDTNNESYLNLIDSWIDAEDQELRQLAAEKLTVNASLADDIRDKWNAFTKEVSAVAAHSETHRRLAYLDDWARSTQERVAMLRSDLEQSLKESWDEAYEAALGSALTVTRIESETPPLYPPRNLPLLYLDGHLKTNAAIEKYLTAWQAGQLTPAIYAQLRDAPNSDPPHKTYLAFVAQAYVLGVTNRWQLSAVTAALAISVARDYRERDPDDAKKNRISGREAAFWRAHSLRSSARRMGDLDPARAALKLARDYSKEDLEDAKGNGLDTKDIRFDAEELAINVTAMCFRMFSEESGSRPTSQLLDNAMVMLSYSSERLDYITEKTNLVELLKDNTHRFSAFAFQRIITNFFTLALCVDGHRKLNSSEMKKNSHNLKP